LQLTNIVLVHNHVLRLNIIILFNQKSSIVINIRVKSFFFSWASKNFPKLIIYLLGFTSLSLEILAGKVLAPFLGETLLSWSCIIATTLLGSALGYLLGGWGAHRLKPMQYLLSVFLVLSLFLLCMPFGNDFIGSLIREFDLNPIAVNILHTTLVFGPLFVLLGTISPMACKMLFDVGSEPAQLAKCFYYGTGGAITGVYATGFFFLKWFSYSKLSSLLALIFVILAVALFFFHSVFVSTELDFKPKKPVKDKINYLLPGFLLFSLSAFIMALEITGSRLISAHLGSSIYTWTAVIGSVLIGLSVGNIVSVWFLKKVNLVTGLSWVLLLISISVLIIPYVNNYFSDELHHRELSWVSIIVITGLLSLLLPAILTGMAEVMITYPLIQAKKKQGYTMGIVFSVWACGGVCGALISAIYLIPHCGSLFSLLCISLIPCVCALIIGKQKFLTSLLLSNLLCIIFNVPIPFSEDKNLRDILQFKKAHSSVLIYHDESAYGDINIFRAPLNSKIKKLNINGLNHSTVDTSQPMKLNYNYEKVFDCIIKNQSIRKFPNVLMIGGGGYVYPSYFSKNQPESKIEVIEIDPAVTKAACLHFGLSKNPSFTIFHGDARNRVSKLKREISQQKKENYNIIIGDAFNSYNIPFHLTTVEFNDQLAALLNPSGIYLLNVIADYKQTGFLGVIYKTLKESFDKVHIYGNPDKSILRETFVFACSQKRFNLQAIDRDIKMILEKKVERLSPSVMHDLLMQKPITLRDDYAPVEVLTAALVNSRKRPAFNYHLKKVYSLLVQKKKVEALDYLDNKLHNFIGYKGVLEKLSLRFLEDRDLKSASRVLRKLAKIDPSSEHKVLVNLGIVYMNMGELKEAQACWEKALVLNPKKSFPHINLAQTYFKTGQSPLGIKHIRLAIEVEPGIRSLVVQLARNYEKSKQYTKCIQLLKVLFESDNNTAVYNYNLSQKYFKKNLKDIAKLYLKQVLQLEPTHISALNDLAVSYALEGEMNESLGIWLRLSELQPNNPIFYQNCAVNYWQLKKYEQAWAQVALIKKYGGKVNFKFLNELKRDSMNALPLQDKKTSILR